MKNAVLGICVLMFIGSLGIAADGMDKKNIYEEVAGFFSCILIMLLMFGIDKPDQK